MIEWRIPLAPGEHAELWVSFPYGPVDRTTGKKIAQLDRNKLWADVQAFLEKHRRHSRRHHRDSRLLCERLSRRRGGADGGANRLSPRRQNLDV